MAQDTAAPKAVSAQAGTARPGTPVPERPILFVGDIQGCSAELAALLERARFSPGAHRLIALGDTINRGPDAPGVFRLLRQARAEPLQGNHERSLLALAGQERPPEHALRPESAYRQLAAAGLWADAVTWMTAWPLWLEGQDWLAVHAGLHPLLPVQQTEPEFLTTVRYCSASGDRPTQAAEPPPAGFRPWHAWYNGRRTVMFGHWARQGLLLQPRLRGLDTGCVYGGKLTGLWWPEDRLVQIPARKAGGDG